MDTPLMKFELSPADSLCHDFGSTPGTEYTSLFETSDLSHLDPSDALTPPFDDNDMLFDDSLSGTVDGTPAPEKKQVKKRKSWGQQLPEPKTNLPPRKRAKTEDEKEQRRVERVLRNRRAAQSSRERKRQEVEALEAQKQEIERRYRDLEMRLNNSEHQNMILQQQIAKLTGGSPPAFKPTSPVANIPEQQYRQPSPLTLSQELFSSQDSEFQPTINDAHSNLQSSLQTVNPASLSPEVGPVDESFNASSTDLTQHSAAMLCDLQCQSVEQRPWMSSSPMPFQSLIMVFHLMSMMSTSTFLTPLLSILNSLRMGSLIQPTAVNLITIIWLATTRSILTSPNSSTTTTPRTSRNKRFSLRMNLLRRLLACSPALARPLMDATMGTLRQLASEQQTHTRDCLDGGVSAETFGSFWNLVGEKPSMASHMTLLWATKVIDRDYRQNQKNSPISHESQGIGRASKSELEELFRREVGVHGWKPNDFVFDVGKAS